MISVFPCMNIRDEGKNTILYISFVHVMAFSNYENRKGIFTAYDFNIHTLSPMASNLFINKKNQYLLLRNIFIETMNIKNWVFSK